MLTLATDKTMAQAEMKDVDELLALELYDISEPQKWALAQLVKRIHWEDMRKLATSDEETESMASAVVKLQQALDDAGYSPR